MPTISTTTTISASGTPAVAVAITTEAAAAATAPMTTQLQWYHSAMQNLSNVINMANFVSNHFRTAYKIISAAIGGKINLI